MFNVWVGGSGAYMSIWPLWVHSYIHLVPSKAECLEVSDVDGGDLRIRVR